MASHGHTTVESEDRPEAQLPCCAPCCKEVLAEYATIATLYHRKARTATERARKMQHGWARASRSVEMQEPDVWQHKQKHKCSLMRQRSMPPC